MRTFTLQKQQRGAFLLEALIAILIFSMGILALVGLQAVSINTVSEAKYRTDAAFLASQIIGEMWIADRNNVPNFSYPGGGAPALATWADQVTATLPDAQTYPPQIVVAGTAANGFTVQVTVNWKSPGSADPSGHTEVAFIRNP
jgi:type IV pilus assembly protein PilV